MKHCEDYIRDKKQPKCLRKFLLYKRIPATWQIDRWRDKWGIPELFATYKGMRVRVNVASRFGDVGIRLKTDIGYGYDLRVTVADLKDFSDER